MSEIHCYRLQLKGNLEVNRDLEMISLTFWGTEPSC